MLNTEVYRLFIFEPQGHALGANGLRILDGGFLSFVFLVVDSAMRDIMYVSILCGNYEK